MKRFKDFYNGFISERNQTISSGIMYYEHYIKKLTPYSLEALKALEERGIDVLIETLRKKGFSDNDIGNSIFVLTSEILRYNGRCLSLKKILPKMLEKAYQLPHKKEIEYLFVCDYLPSLKEGASCSM